MNTLKLSRNVASKIDWENFDIGAMSTFLPANDPTVSFKCMQAIDEKGTVDLPVGADFIRDDAYYAIAYPATKQVMIEKGSVLIKKAKKTRAKPNGVRLHLKNIGELVVAMLSDDAYMTPDNVKKVFYESLHLLKESVLSNLLSYADLTRLFAHSVSFGKFETTLCSSWRLTIPYTEKMPTKITIKASEVAACIGKNPYKKPDEVLLEMWKKYSPETFEGETTDERNRKAAMASPQTRALFFDLVKMKPTNSDEVSRIIEETLVKVNADTNLTATQRTHAGEHMRKALFTSHGTRSEAKTADQDEVQLQVDNSFHKYSVVKIGEIEFEIVGKIDRFHIDESGNKVLVEIKNRARRLFNELKEYEHIQVQTYLQMLDLQNGRLTEQMNDDRRHYFIERDDRMWRDEIMTGLVAYCEDLHRKVFA